MLVNRTTLETARLGRLPTPLQQLEKWQQDGLVDQKAVRLGVVPGHKALVDAEQHHLKRAHKHLNPKTWTSLGFSAKFRGKPAKLLIFTEISY